YCFRVCTDLGLHVEVGKFCKNLAVDSSLRNTPFACNYNFTDYWPFLDSEFKDDSAPGAVGVTDVRVEPDKVVDSVEPALKVVQHRACKILAQEGLNNALQFQLGNIFEAFEDNFSDRLVKVPFVGALCAQCRPGSEKQQQKYKLLKGVPHQKLLGESVKIPAERQALVGNKQVLGIGRRPVPLNKEEWRLPFYPEFRIQ